MGWFNISEQFLNYVEGSGIGEGLDIYWKDKKGRKEIDKHLDEMDKIESRMKKLVGILTKKINDFMEVKDNE